jgi:hypothetical protein
VELGEGVIVREVATPKLQGNGKYDINNKNSASPCNLVYRAKDIIEVYRNGVPDPKWTILRNDSSWMNGLAATSIAGADYDPTASYTVTYLALDKYQLTNNAVTATGEYQTNLRTVLAEAVADLANVQTDVSMIKNTYAKKQQGQWIAPTLLNGWVNFGSTNGSLHEDAGYFKDELGIVHLKGTVMAGASTTIMFILPAGYRPKAEIMFPVTIHDGNTDNQGRLSIYGDGSIKPYVVSNYWVCLDGISFRTEQ